MTGALGQLRTKESIDRAWSEVRNWLSHLHIGGLDLIMQHDAKTNVAILRFKYKEKNYEFRSTKQSNCRLNAWGIARVIEYKVRSQIMGIEEFEKSMKAYLALPNYSSEQNAPNLQEPNAKAYIILGISELSSNEEIKEHYKKMMKAFHPDFALSQEAKAEFEKRASEINLAYDDIKRERGM